MQKIKYIYLIVFSLLFCYSIHKANAQSDAWQAILKNKKGEVVVLWSRLEPFIYKKKIGNKEDIVGIEADVFREFIKMLEKKYKVSISIKWKEMPSFSNVVAEIRKQPNANYFGASALSYLESRKDSMDFTPPYIPDISVMISNSNVDIFLAKEDFAKSVENLKAYTAKGSTYELDLFKLRKELNKNFPIYEIKATDDLVTIIHNNPNSFGYIDFPIYLKYYEKGYKIKRQFVFKTKRSGYAFGISKNHDWQEPIDFFFKSTYFRTIKNKYISNYIGTENMALLWDLSGGEESSTLKKEKNIQDKKFVEQILQTERQRNLFFISLSTGLATVFLVLIIAGILYYRYRIRGKANQLLTLKNEEISQQKSEIEAQRDYIEKKNSELNTAIEQIQLQKEELEKLNANKDRFFSIIAHDLRSPINSLSGFTNLLANYADSLSMEEIKTISKDLDNALQNVLQLIQDLLTWARTQMNQIEFNPNIIDINKLITEDLELSNLLFQKKEIALNVHIEENLTAYADLDHIKFIFRNLLTNALKFTKKGGNVLVQATKFENFVKIEVADNGVGMPEEVRNRLFKMEKIKSTQGTENEKGTGLGLLLCQDFILKNGGTIWVESKENEGSKFSFLIPQMDFKASNT